MRGRGRVGVGVGMGAWAWARGRGRGRAGVGVGAWACGRGRVGVGVGEGAGRGRWARALGEGAALRCWWGPGGARRARRARGPWRESGGHQWRACSSIRVSVLCCECAGSAIIGMIEAMSSGKPHQAPMLYLLPPVGHSGTWAWRAAGD